MRNTSPSSVSQSQSNYDEPTSDVNSYFTKKRKMKRVRIISWQFSPTQFFTFFQPPLFRFEYSSHAISMNSYLREQRQEVYGSVCINEYFGSHECKMFLLRATFWHHLLPKTVHPQWATHSLCASPVSTTSLVLNAQSFTIDMYSTFSSLLVIYNPLQKFLKEIESATRAQPGWVWSCISFTVSFEADYK
jgi:exocyst complex component 4